MDCVNPQKFVDEFNRAIKMKQYYEMILTICQLKRIILHDTINIKRI